MNLHHEEIVSLLRTARIDTVQEIRRYLALYPDPVKLDLILIGMIAELSIPMDPIEFLACPQPRKT